jgi:LacI family transcriptional regulator
VAVKLSDIAASLGVSEATVSLALSGNPRVADATRQRVVAAANELGYRPNTAARALRTDTTRTMGLIVSDAANPFFGELAREIERHARESGFAVMLCNSDEDATRQDDYLLDLLGGSRVDGVLLVPASSVTPGLRAAGAARAKLVIVDRPLSVSGTGDVADHLRSLPMVRSDTSQALAEAAELLATLGHTSVGVVAPPQNTPLGRVRRTEIHDALVAAGMSPRGICVEEGDFRERGGFQATIRLLERKRRPTAVIAADGPMAVGALKAARTSGLRVPMDLSLLCFDDAPWLELLSPPITAVAQPIADIADAAVQSLLALIRGGPQPEVGTLRPACTFVRRASCGVPPA